MLLISGKSQYRGQMHLKKTVADVRREIREHPERFDYGDCPPELTEAQKTAIHSQPKPAYLEARLAEVAATK